MNSEGRLSLNSNNIYIYSDLPCFLDPKLSGGNLLIFFELKLLNDAPWQDLQEFLLAVWEDEFNKGICLCETALVMLWDRIDEDV